MALVTFRSKAAGEIYMFRETAEKIFKIIGKPLGVRGAIDPEEIPAAISALQAEIEREKHLIEEAKRKEEAEFRTGKDLDKEKIPAMNEHVFFAQRVFPFLEMLQFAQKENEPIVWGL